MDLPSFVGGFSSNHFLRFSPHLTNERKILPQNALQLSRLSHNHLLLAGFPTRAACFGTTVAF
jgi:hypothetical protein